MNPEKMDSISIKTSDIRPLLLWRDQHKELVRKMNPVLTKGIIKIVENEQTSTGIVFKHISNKTALLSFVLFLNRWKTIYQMKFDFSSSLAQSLTDVDFNDNFWKTMRKSYLNEPEPDKAVINALQEDVLTIYSSLMAFMANHKSDLRFVEIEKEFRNHGSQSKKKQKKNKNKKIKISATKFKIVKIGELEITTTTTVPQTFQRHTDNWKVRGHWRTLKSGKQTWVKEHNKGKKEPAAKEYVVKP